MLNSFIILDLEWNCNRYSNGFFNEIIEIGAVKLNGQLEVCDTFQTFVKPKAGHTLTSVVKRLTHIKNEDLASAPKFEKVYERFLNWAGDTDVLLCFGNLDVLVLLENLRAYSMPEKIEFVSYYADMQRFCQKRLGKSLNQLLSLSAMAELAGIDTQQMSMHRALDDSIVSAKIFKKLYDSKEFQNEMYENNERLYRRLMFKPFVITDIDSSYVCRADMHLKCPQCGAFLKRIEGWQSKNKYFRAMMECGRCKKEFSGKVRFRMEFDGVAVKSVIAPTEKNTKEN